MVNNAELQLLMQERQSNQVLHILRDSRTEVRVHLLISDLTHGTHFFSHAHIT